MDIEETDRQTLLGHDRHAEHDREHAAPPEIVTEFGGVGIEGVGALLPWASGTPMRRATSVTWWGSSTADTHSESEAYTRDSEDTSLSSTRASTSAATTGPGSNSRLGRRSTRGFSVVIRGARSPNVLIHGLAEHGYRGRSVTRREHQNPGAALRHRHPTHTPSRRPDTPTRRAIAAALRRDFPSLIVPYIGLHAIGRVREEQAEGTT
eukprot:TRINITY_DN57255_c0_g1_i1.p1 TRINITY_DN57255_c0_g1~~TRINITY_DN57255_c0_g1_i1.p1  ORF type:complete len:208 (-),score=24.78 TRINITY_DN57255_c0_g1_i1:83-706(-)